MPITEIQTHLQLLAIGQAAALLRSNKLSAKSFSPGYMADVLLGLSAALSEEAQRYALQRHLTTFFKTAKGADLDKLALDHFGLKRQPGVPAIGEVTFSRPTDTAGNVLIPAGTRITTVGGVGFVTTEEPLMTGLSIDSNIKAEELGEAGIVAAATIVVIDAVLTDTTVVVTNAEETAGGTPQETDSAFRERIIDFLVSLRRGTGEALEIGARSVAGVATASVDESSYPPTVYVADAAGSSNTVLEVAVDDELVNWRAAGIQVNVLGAVILIQAVALTLVYRAGFNTSETRELVAAAIIAYVATLKIGERLYHSALVAAALSVDGILDAQVTDPSGDVVPNANQLLRTLRADITV